MNSIYASMQQNSMQSQYQQFAQNPFQFLMSKNINIPPQFQNDPRGAVQYLMNNGKMSQNQFNYYSQVAQSMGVRLT